MQHINQLISARWVLPIIPRNTVHENYSVAIDHGKIVEVLPTIAAQKKYQAREHIVLNDHVVMPGLINAHTHAAMTLFRSLADDLPLLTWLQQHMWPAEGAVINGETVRLGTQLAMAEMIKSGTTCFNDMYFFFPEVVEAVLAANMRACCSMTIMNVPTAWAKTEAEYLQKAREAYCTTPKNELVSWLVAPQGAYTNSDDSLRQAKLLADELSIYLHAHAHETQAEITMDFNKHGKRALQRMHDAGMLNEKCSLAHMVHLTDAEIALVKEKGVSIVHCPESNMKLGSGFSNMPRLAAMGINIALGTDGASSNNDLDMFGEMRTAALLGKGVSEDASAVPAMTALTMATLNGAKALGIEQTTGSLTIGKAADVVAINLDVLETQPIFDPISHLVYAASRQQVTDVWVAGKQVLKNRQLTTLNIDDLKHKLLIWQERLQKKATVA